MITVCRRFFFFQSQLGSSSIWRRPKHVIQQACHFSSRCSLIQSFCKCGTHSKTLHGQASPLSYLSLICVFVFLQAPVLKVSSVIIGAVLNMEGKGQRESAAHDLYWQQVRSLHAMNLIRIQIRGRERSRSTYSLLLTSYNYNIWGPIELFTRWWYPVCHGYIMAISLSLQ